MVAAMISVLQSPDPLRCTIRTYPDIHTGYDFIETTMELGPLLQHINELSAVAVRIAQEQKIRARDPQSFVDQMLTSGEL